jgi:hypothetical protein
MQDQINNIEKIQAEQGIKIDKMYSALVGDEMRKGIIHEIEENTKYRKSDTKQKYYITGFAAAVGIAAGFFKKHILDFFAS